MTRRRYTLDELLAGSEHLPLQTDADRAWLDATAIGREVFALDDERFAEFMAMLDAPPEPNPGLDRLLAVKAPWEDDTQRQKGEVSSSRWV
ncbi:DUF1778 domain-containing protein [Methylocella sp.]|uniref:type II toxin-antitoxin system TacA family antitoxin n=1 Tax=Methylocella sp. TaxID=1978226 RepID=UPI0035AFA82B